MKKIVINRCFGGFNLSDEAFELYLNKKGLKFFKYPSLFSSSDYYSVPREQYEEAKIKWYKEDGNYGRINETGWFLSSHEFDRDDEVLIQVIEEMGEKSFGRCAELKIVEIPEKVEWQIEEYDGMEHVAEKHRTWI